MPKRIQKNRSAAKVTAKFDKAWMLETLAQMPGSVAMPLGKAGSARAKNPQHFGWQRQRYNSGKVIDRCIREGRNIGFRLSPHVIVADLDPRAWESGLDPYVALAADHGIDTEAGPRWRTGGGGYHQPYIIPEGQEGKFVKSLADGFELRSGQGQMIVAPGSVHPNGKRYSVERDGAPVTAPKKLLKLACRPDRSGEAVDGGTYTSEDLARALESIDPAKFPTNDEWLPIMQACHHATAGEGRDAFVAWSIQDPAFADDAAKIGARWDSLDANRNDGVTFKTLNKALREHGDASLVPAAARQDVAAEDDFPDDMPDSDDWMNGGGVEDWMNGEDDDDSPSADDPTNAVAVMSHGLEVHPKTGKAYDTFGNALIAVHKSGLTVAFNEMAKRVEFIGGVPWSASFGTVLDDKTLSAFRVYVLGKFQGNGFDPAPKHLLDAVHAVAYRNRFNPVWDYLDSLEWDGTPRLAKLFGHYFNCGVDAYTRGVSLAFMVGAVRRIRLPGCKFDTLPVLKSPQGWNKSTALRLLFGNDYYSDSPLGPLTNKDAAMKLRGLWLHEFAEIESLRKHEVNTLKAFVSALSDRGRDPYDKLVSEVPRSNVFAGTVNEGAYLGDSTGGRRFWPLDLKARIDLAALEADRDQLWAEAAALEADGFSVVLPESLWDAAGKRQQAETLADPWEDELRTYLARRAALAAGGAIEDDDGDLKDPPPADKVHLSDLFDLLEIPARDRTKAAGGRLRSIMETRLGWTHKASLRIEGAVKVGFAAEM